MSATYFTIEGIDDDKFPQDHPDSLKFYDHQTAEAILKLLKALNIVSETASVAEYRGRA